VIALTSGQQDLGNIEERIDPGEVMDLADDEMHCFRGGHDADAHAFGWLRKLTWSGITAISTAEATVAIATTTSALRTKFTPASPAPRVAPVIATIVAAASTVIAVTPLAGSIVITGLR
jgi:hypothetical protein